MKLSTILNLSITKPTYPRTQKSTNNNYFPEVKALPEQYYKEQSIARLCLADRPILSCREAAKVVLDSQGSNQPATEPASHPAEHPL